MPFESQKQYCWKRKKQNLQTNAQTEKMVRHSFLKAIADKQTNVKVCKAKYIEINKKGQK